MPDIRESGPLMLNVMASLILFVVIAINATVQLDVFLVGFVVAPLGLLAIALVLTGTAWAVIRLRKKASPSYLARWALAVSSIFAMQLWWLSVKGQTVGSVPGGF